jgi:hypothetical protein
MCKLRIGQLVGIWRKSLFSLISHCKLLSLDQIIEWVGVIIMINDSLRLEWLSLNVWISLAVSKGAGMCKQWCTVFTLFCNKLNSNYELNRSRYESNPTLPTQQQLALSVSRIIELIFSYITLHWLFVSDAHDFIPPTSLLYVSELQDIILKKS